MKFEQITKIESQDKHGIKENDWPEHNRKLSLGEQETPVFESFSRALDMDQIQTHALSLGTGGNISDLEVILSKPYENILCVDLDSAVEGYIQESRDERIAFINSSLEELSLRENKFSFISGNYVLSFLDKEDLKSFLEKISRHLSENGIFQGNVFGEKDDWYWNNKEKNIGQNLEKYSKSGIENILMENFDIVEIKESEHDDESLSGKNKHWHDIRFIVKKKESVEEEKLGVVLLDILPNPRLRDYQKKIRADAIRLKNNFHITLAYGLDNEKFDENILDKIEISELELGELELFYIEELNQNALVVKIVDENLISINDNLTQDVLLEDRGVRYDFNPHITLGYVGLDYMPKDKDILKGKKVEVDKVRYKTL